MQKISKNEILKLLKQYNINEASMEQSDASIKVYIDFSKQTMNKQPTIRELILNVTSEVKEMKSDIKHIKDQLDNIEVRLDHVEEDIQQIKNCPTIKKELAL